MNHRIRTSLAFACGALVIAVPPWLSPNAQAQTAMLDNTTAIHVCVAPDGVLRAVAMSATCSAEQRSLYLKKAVPEPGVADPKTGSGDAQAVDKRRIAELEARVKNLEDAANRGELGNRVTAPFDVVDRAGKRIFHVEEGFVAIYNSAGKLAARISANDSGGTFTGYSATVEDLATSVGAVGDQAGLRVVDAAGIRIDLGRKPDDGHYVLKFFGSGGKVLAGIGQSNGGPGLAFVADATGKVKGRMYVTGQNKGKFSVSNDAETEVGMLVEGAYKGGLLRLSSSGGVPMVEAGVTAEGFGVVRAGPESFKPGYGVLGLPGSYISGKP